MPSFTINHVVSTNQHKVLTQIGIALSKVVNGECIVEYPQGMKQATAMNFVNQFNGITVEVPTW